MKNIIEELYNGNVHPLEDVPYTKQMKEVIGYVSRHKETLQGLLDDKGRETLEKLVFIQGSIARMSDTEAFF